MEKKSPLNNKSFCYLGSSVTRGSAANDVSFVENISRRNNTKFYKDAENGTTLTKIKDGDNSYVSRLERINKNLHFDVFVVQLSTNDAMKKIKVGSMEDTKPTTICGAINYIIDYIRENWNAQVIFYTSPYFYNEYYNRMVVALTTVCKYKKVPIIDMYDDYEFNQLTKEKRKRFMADKIHPTSLGYHTWITPRMERDLYKFVK
jgi:lysophospholipase L1-like esterase